MGSGGALLQAAVTTTLAAGALDPPLAVAGLVATLLVACKNSSVALFVAIVHLAVVIARVPTASDIPVVSVGLLGGMLLTPWAISAVITWAISVVASVVTVYELGADLWLALPPIAAVSVLLGGITYAMRARQLDHPKRKRDDVEAPVVPPPVKPTRRRETRSDMFV